MNKKLLSGCYQNRFEAKDLAKRRKLWRVLVDEYFQQFIAPSDTVMDIGAGYCEFINAISCAKKIAVDPNPDTRQYAQKNVGVIQSTATGIGKQYDNVIDIIWMSNFLEHLQTKEDMLAVLVRARALLRPGGRLLILQPNIDLVHEHYWDFIDHHIALNTASVAEALTLSGFKIERIVRRLLPYTTKSNLPIDVLFLVRWYLRFPEWLRVGAGQSFFVARKAQ